jgi:hypothetical protein
MSTEIGTVNINLRMSMAQFKTDVTDGASAASKATKQIADDTTANLAQARGSMALLGEEIGITIPRHLQTFIAELPGVGTALNAAFSSIAIIALIEVLAKVVTAVQEFKQHAEDVENAMEHAGDGGRAAMQKLDDEFRKLTITIDGLQGDNLKALQDTLADIDKTKLENIQKQFTDLQKEADATFEASRVGWLKNLVGLGNNEALNNLKEGFEEVTNSVKNFEAAGDSIAAGNEIQVAIFKIQDALSKPIKDSVIEDQLKNELTYLNLIADAHLKVARNADASKEIAQLTEQNRAEQDLLTQRNKEAEQLEQLSNATANMLSKNDGAYATEITKAQELIKRWQDYKVAWEAAHNGISTVANAQIEKLQNEVTMLKDEADAAIDNAMKAAALANSVNVGKQAQTWVSPPLYGGTKEAQELYDIQTKDNAAVAEAQKIYSATRTSAEEYQQQVAILDSLLKNGQIDQQTYNRGIYEAKQKYDDVTIAAKDFGSSVFDSIKTGALWGSSWKQNLESIGIELVQLILKMTLLKSLTASASAGGGGGFFTALLSGFGGMKAEGGPVSGDTPYIVGEQGPELFMPKSGGSIVPNSDLMKSKTEVHNHNTAHIFNINGVTDFDSFKQNASQVSAQMYAAMATAARRKG